MKENPYVLIGDLNASPQERAVETLFSVTKPVETKLLSFPSDQPAEKLDYLLISDGLNAHSPYAIGTDVSDHLAVGCFIS